jgi:hypothetical protein
MDGDDAVPLVPATPKPDLALGEEEVPGAWEKKVATAGHAVTLCQAGSLLVADLPTSFLCGGGGGISKRRATRSSASTLVAPTTMGGCQARALVPWAPRRRRRPRGRSGTGVEGGGGSTRVGGEPVGG